MDYLVGANSDVGISRDINQDSLILQVVDTNLGRMTFAAVCDGMGGMNQGELASATLVEELKKWVEHDLAYLCAEELNDGDFKQSINRLISEVNYRIFLYGRENDIRLGTTMVGVLITPKRYYCFNIGDSRMYLVKQRAIQITEDHSVVYEEYKKGILSYDELATDSRNNILTRSVGINSTTMPEFFFGDIVGDETFVLCSDGAHHSLNFSILESRYKNDTILDEEDLNSKLQLEVDRIKETGETDNITILAVCVRG